jgi:pimeloyl-ACP methyl ester carboxylesterase
MGRWRSIRRWGLRIGLGGLALLVILCGVGWLWERSEETAFNELSITPPGQMVQVGDHAVHVVVRGQGSPGVLFIGGLGQGATSSAAFQSRLAESTRVISYDRPGLGWSPPLEGDWTLDAAVEDVAGLLAAPGLFDGPPILVGHSLGGQIARRFAHAHPGRVSGLVLLDSPPDLAPTGFLMRGRGP